MKCEKCKSEWNSSKSIQVCPFCGESLVQPESEKPEDILSYIIEKYGIEVFQKKKLLLSYFSDFAPHLSKEYKLLKNCCSTDFISILLSIDSSSKDSRDVAIKKAIQLLMDECFLSEEYARNVVGWITIALNWEKSVLVIQPQISIKENAPQSEKEETYCVPVPKSTNNSPKRKQRTPIHFGEKVELARSYLEGREGYEKNVIKAKELLFEASNEGDVHATIMLVELCIQGRSRDFLEIDEYGTKAEIILDKRIDLIQERKKLADLYDKIFNERYFNNGRAYGGKKHLQKAFDYYCQVLSNDKYDHEVLSNVGWYLFIQEYNSEYLDIEEEELFLLIQEEEKKSTNPNLAYLLGYIYKNGFPSDVLTRMIHSLKVEKSQSESEKMFLIAKQKGSPDALCELALYYIKDKKAHNKVFAFLKEAYEKGAINAGRLLGLCYKSGIGVKRNRSKAKALFAEAARQGDTQARAELSKMWF